MNTLSDLTDALEQQASRGTPRGADEVLAGARDAEPSTDRGGRRVQPFVAAIAVVGGCLFVGLAVLWTRADDTSLVTTTAPAPPSALASLTVEGGTVAVVGTGFDRVWVATRDSESLPAESHLRSFDPATGEELSETTLVGDVYRFALTGRYVWVRATTGGPASFPVGAGGLGDNAIYRVDPTSGEATPMRYLNGDGPLAGTESRISAADASHLEIVGEDGQLIASATIDEAAGVSDATLPGTNRILGLAFSEGVDAPPAIYAILQGGRELLQLDLTGRHMATVDLADTADTVGPAIATAGDRVWIGTQPSGLIQVTVPLGAESEPSILPTPVRVEQLHPLNDRQLLVSGGGVAAIVDFDSAEMSTTPLASGDQTQLLVVDGRAWAAQWSAPEGATTRIRFTIIDDQDVVGSEGDRSVDGAGAVVAPGDKVVVTGRVYSIDGRATEVCYMPGPELPGGGCVGLAVVADESADLVRLAGGEPTPVGRLGPTFLRIEGTLVLDERSSSPFAAGITVSSASLAESVGTDLTSPELRTSLVHQSDTAADLTVDDAVSRWMSEIGQPDALLGESMIGSQLIERGVALLDIQQDGERVAFIVEHLGDGDLSVFDEIVPDYLPMDVRSWVTPA